MHGKLLDYTPRFSRFLKQIHIYIYILHQEPESRRPRVHWLGQLMKRKELLERDLLGRR